MFLAAPFGRTSPRQCPPLRGCSLMRHRCKSEWEDGRLEALPELGVGTALGLSLRRCQVHRPGAVAIRPPIGIALFFVDRFRRGVNLVAFRRPKAQRGHPQY